MRGGRRGGRKAGRRRSVHRWADLKERDTGWHKGQPAASRRRRMVASTPKNQTRRHRYLHAYHRMDALAKVSKDSGTRRAARADAEYFRRKVGQ